MSQKRQEQLLHRAAAEIKRARQDAMDKMRKSIEDDIKDFEEKGLDPTKGRGRGPLWAQGD